MISRHVKNNPLMKAGFSFAVDLPVPVNISMLWNLGSLLGLCLVIQIVTGIFLAMNFSADTGISFFSVSHIFQDVNFGWLMRMVHANGASLFFFCLYGHVARGVYYMSYYYKETWNVGVVLLLLVMATAFLGYVLPWGQMSFWGATVITNLFSAIPYLGGDIVIWLWGGFSVDNATLTRFFSFHFLVPFIIAGAAMVHLVFLHETGSSNPLGLKMMQDKVSFSPYFLIKDLMGAMLLLLMFFYIVLEFPWLLGDPENFIAANPMVTPVHIQPEWYFLFAYAILRAIPNKLGGVLALAGAIMIFFLLPFQYKSKFRGLFFYPLNKIYFWSWSVSAVLLTWIGMRPVEEPYIFVGQLLSIYYFFYFFFYSYILSYWDKSLD